MAKNKRTYNPNKIRSKHAHTLKELAEKYNVHIRTTQEWRKQGLTCIEGSHNPYLFWGEEIRRFLKTKQQKRKFPLAPGEFFCPRCKTQRKSIPGEIQLEITDKNLGEIAKKAIIKGVCSVCGQSLTLFSSVQKAKKMIEKGVFIMEQEIILTGLTSSTLNTD
jgi:transcription elongation factor Elf1